MEIFFLRSRCLLITLSQGDGSSRFQHVSSNWALAEAGWQHDLNKFVVDEYGISRPGVGMKRMADTVEAIIGAVWVDSRKSHDAVKTALIGLFGADKVDSVEPPPSPLDSLYVYV